MLQGIETVFDNKEKMLKHLKKKSYEENTEIFRERNGHYFHEMAEYVGQADDKEAAASEIGECLVKAVNDHFSNKKGKPDSRTQVDLNFFMIYYVFPSVLGLAGDDSGLIAEGICQVWGKSFKESSIQYTDYDTLYQSFREKIFGIF